MYIIFEPFRSISPLTVPVGGKNVENMTQPKTCLEGIIIGIRIFPKPFLHLSRIKYLRNSYS